MATRVTVAEDEGRAAFRGIAGAVADHLRGTKGEPRAPRNPYRRRERLEAWERGFAAERDGFMREWGPTKEPTP